jgi:hypothetical protein
MQLAVVVQATAFSWLTAAPAGFGVGTILHAVPFQLSASVCLTPAGFTYCPTAMQAEADTHFTPRSSRESRTPGVVEGLAVGWICQLVPSQCTASVALMPALLSK